METPQEDSARALHRSTAVATSGAAAGGFGAGSGGREGQRTHTPEPPSAGSCGARSVVRLADSRSHSRVWLFLKGSETTRVVPYVHMYKYVVPFLYTKSLADLRVFPRLV